jgi:hypothetical protein
MRIWCIAATCRRTAWLVKGIAVWGFVIPIAVRGVRNRAADVGQHIDGRT